ncbi:hypothetical protein [Sebaldella termitidis]|uniref:hypothetical protein n=1 Tax=Sebaldella termitidis TaxID=826 RepID=UPI003EBC727F
MKNDIAEILAGQFSDYIKENGIVSAAEVSVLMRKLFDKIHENMIIDAEISQITSPNIVAEVIDEKTGLLFRRYLEIEYSENSNGLMISGENIKGEKSEIVFLSETAVSRISELKGSGSDSPHCSE